MRTPGPTVVVIAVALAGAALASWTVYEARRQRGAIEETLSSEAALLAEALGPGLSAASAATAELDELVTGRLLADARYLAELDAAGALDEARLARLAEASDLTHATVLDPGGRSVLSFGAGDFALGRLAPILAGEAEEVVLGSVLDEGAELFGAAVERPGGGAVAVQAEPLVLRAFSRRLGVESLLDDLVQSGSLLYLSYRETPSDRLVEASWDDGPLPAAAADGQTVHTLRGRSVFETVVPVAVPAGRQASLRVGLDGEPLRRSAAEAMRRSLLIGLVLLAMGLSGTGFALVSRLRVREREAAMRLLNAAERAQRRSERLAAAGALTAGLAHEVRSPLNAIALAAQRLERKLHDDDERRGMAVDIHREVRRLETVLREFLELASPVSERRERADLLAIAEDVAGLLSDEAAGRGVGLAASGPSVCAEVDGEAIRRALINLVRNGIEASEPGGRVEILVEPRADEVRLRVLDEGRGIDPGLGERIFDPFVTGRPEGTGLGLSLVRRVAEEHGGSAEVESRAEGGTEARLRLPSNVRENAR